jgi:hypothetical protein
LLTAGEAVRDGEAFRVTTAAGVVQVPADMVRTLQADGAVGGDSRRAVALPGTAQWLKRQRLDADAFAAQHREPASGPEGMVLNLAESPLARLATASGGEPAFLARH